MLVVAERIAWLISRKSSTATTPTTTTTETAVTTAHTPQQAPAKRQRELSVSFLHRTTPTDTAPALENHRWYLFGKGSDERGIVCCCHPS
jgi:hypothetical protein